MPEYAVPAPKRRRGRPPGATSTARERILAAAIDEFGDHGYDGATMRAIAARAEVDAALVHHYFGTKADLFSETIGAPFRPDLELPRILAGPRDGVGEGIVRFVLTAWDKPEVQRRGVVLMRAAMGNKLTTPLLTGYLSRELVGRIARELGSADAELRASLAASQIAGLIVARYIVKLPGVAGASIDDLASRVGPAVQRYLLG